jgi:hypothetical protein
MMSGPAVIATAVPSAASPMFPVIAQISATVPPPTVPATMLPTAEFIEFFDVSSMKGFLLEAGGLAPGSLVLKFYNWEELARHLLCVFKDLCFGKLAFEIVGCRLRLAV